MKAKSEWKPKFLWNPDWTEPKVVAYAEELVLGDTFGGGIVAVVEFPLPENALQLGFGTVPQIQFDYSPSFLPRPCALFDPGAGSCRTFDPDPAMMESVKALLRRARASTTFELRIKLENDYDHGFAIDRSFESTFGERQLKQWLIAWLWPFMNERTYVFNDWISERLGSLGRRNFFSVNSAIRLGVDR